LKKRVAFVVQRCGLEVNGGSELHCLEVARRLASRCRTEVLTTCALDYVTWENHYPAGDEWLEELRIRRFRVARPRKVSSFNRLSESIRSRIGRLEIAEEEAWMREQGPWAPDLFAHLRERADEYDAFIFFTYLYATTYFGLPLVAAKALLTPTAHDEWPIHLGMWDRFMDLPRAFVFNTEEERTFLRGRFPAARLNGPVVGVAVERPESLDPGTFRRAHGIAGPFVLYLGRMDASKGVDRLLEDFAAYRRATGDMTTQLVLIGRAAMDVREGEGVRVLGFLPEEHKWQALAACAALVMPSPFESLSMACLEAWSLAKPVLVTAKSDVLVGQCKRSQGGLWYSNTDEFCAALECLLQDDRVRQGLGAQGREFVAANYRWPRILDTYGELIESISP
jgi:glycosyltransferase involved in cell wall biosynthesis